MRKMSILFVLAIVLVACAKPEVLPPRNGAVPVGVDLSGFWNIRASGGGDQSRLRAAIRKTSGAANDELFKKPKTETATHSRRTRHGDAGGGLVTVFLQIGDSLKVTQTEHGLFISFDRSVVEEFRFGENRFINVGQIEAQRVTGWEGDTLVVDTLDRNSAKLTERFRLLSDGQVLERTIILRGKSEEPQANVQFFDRVRGQ
jgi:hypothetical protein